MKSNINKKYDVNEKYFQQINTCDKAYFLGLMYADGTVSERSIVISLQERDFHILEKVKENIGYTGPLSFYKSRRKNSQNNAVLRIYSRDLVSDLSNLGCIRNKTYSLRFPVIPEEFQSHFIRGLFDGDGCIMSKENLYYFSITGNKEFLEEVNKIISKSCNIEPCKISRKNKSSEMFGSIQYTKNSTLIKLREFLYKDAKGLHIDRKKEKFFDIHEVIPKVCKLCNAKHEAKGYCKRCYWREVIYKNKKNGKGKTSV